MNPLVLGLFTGVAFGLIVQRVGASDHDMILKTLRLEDLTILKFMALSIALAMVGIYGLLSLDVGKLVVKPTYVLGNIVGGLIFGLGWAISGYCPGTALTAVGEGKVDALFTVLGGFLGAYTLAVVYAPLKPLFRETLNYGKITVTTQVSINAFAIALAFAALIGLGLYGLERRARTRPR